MPDLRLQELLRSGPRERGGPDDAIVVAALAKRYPTGTEAVRGISFRVGAGEVFGILGPNGAGKSTTMGMLGTLVRPTSARATVAGHDLATHPREGAAEHRLRDAGGGCRRVRDRPRADRAPRPAAWALRREAARRAGLLLDVVGLADAASRRMGEYSGGMKRRVDLASALVHLPPGPRRAPRPRRRELLVLLAQHEAE